MPDAIKSRRSDVRTVMRRDVGVRCDAATMWALASWLRCVSAACYACALPCPPPSRTHLRSSMAVLSGLPANTGNTCTVNSDQGELGLECRIVCSMLGLLACSGRPPSAPVGSDVPSGSTITPPALTLCVRWGVSALALANGVPSAGVDAELNADMLEPVELMPDGESGGRGGSCESVDDTCVIWCVSGARDRPRRNEPACYRTLPAPILSGPQATSQEKTASSRWTG